MNAKTIPFLLAISISVLSSPGSSAGTDDSASAHRALLARASDTSSSPALRCEAVNSLETASDPAVLRSVAELAKDPAVESCVIRVLGNQKNGFAEEALLKTVEDYLEHGASKGPFEDNLKKRLAAIDSVWALGEIGTPQLMDKIFSFYDSADDIIKVNLIIGMGKLKNAAKAEPYLYSIAGDPRETEVVRATAFEILEKIGAEPRIDNLVPSKKVGAQKGDMFWTGGLIGSIFSSLSSDMPIGHPGIFAGTKTEDGRIKLVISDCVPDHFVPPGVRILYSWYHFTHHYRYPYYGNRTSRVKPTPSQRNGIVNLALKMGSAGFHYDNFHTYQKGPLKFDCVGYAEYLYEQNGLNPTDSSYESGMGWPLTPYEQFDSTMPNPESDSSEPIPGSSAAADSEKESFQTVKNFAERFSGGEISEPEIGTGTAPQAVN